MNTRFILDFARRRHTLSIVRPRKRIRRAIRPNSVRPKPLQARVHIDEEVFLGFPVQPLDRVAGIGREAFPQFAILYHPPQGGRQSLGVVGRHQQAEFVGLDDLQISGKSDATTGSPAMTYSNNLLESVV